MAEQEDENENSSSILLGGADDAMDEDENEHEEEEEDDDELFQADDEGDEEEDANLPMPQTATTTTTATRELLSTIITPSPFPHHTTGPTSSRFRNAMQRITSHPESDTEAWQALMTEVSTCYKSIKPKLHTVDAEVQLQLDWMESCYGTLLKYFPYSSQHYLAVGEILFAQSSRFGEEEGPLVDYSVDHMRRQQCQIKLEHIFETTLGVDMEGQGQGHSVVESESSGTSTTSNIIPMSTGSVELWLLYVRARVRHARRQTTEEGLLRKSSNQAYELAVENAGFCVQNHLLWKSYLAYAKSQENMVYLRSVYQRLVCHPMTGLDQLWQEYEAFERQQSEQLAAALIGEFTPKYQHARTVYLERNRVYNWNDLDIHRLATPPNPQEWPEHFSTLQLWKTRTAYERTNPERLTPVDLAKRIEQGYKEMICAWTYHPEVWHMWSMWEDVGGGGGATKAIRVLEMAQTHIPDCTLLPHAQAQLLESSEHPNKALEVMQAYVERAPTTLGFALYQQMVRRYKGKDAARAVFAKARRVLVTAEEQQAKAQELKKKLGAEEEGAEEAGAAGDKSKKDEKAKRWMVTNRLDPSIGGTVKTEQPRIKTDEDEENDSNRIPPGVITWHLYAADATIEHRLNKSPETAARVYELGLRKHASFLTQPAYVLKYAQLLLELQDNINLRALLTRALAACQETKSSSVAALWDMALHFESLISIGDPSNVSAALAVERRRRAALMGPEVEDVATGSRVGEGSGPGIGAQKSTVSEQLIRQDGYDLSSSIVNGMSRTVDALDIMGLWGNGVSSTSSRYAINDDFGDNNDDESSMPGGKSDIHYQKRLHYARLVAAGGSSDGPGGADATGSKLLSARERLQQTGAAPSQNTAITMAIQQSPEWLRDLLLLLPASRLRTAVLSKPPPHLTEMALARLRQNKLPAERPQDDAAKSKGMKGKKHQRDGGDSSDEENGGPKSGGYGSQFRSRQRTRQIMASSNGMKLDQ
jgi:hypothetical protein